LVLSLFPFDCGFFSKGRKQRERKEEKVKKVRKKREVKMEHFE
jgi:hypothetical protein